MFTKQFYSLLVWIFGSVLLIISAVLFFSFQNNPDNAKTDDLTKKTPGYVWNFRSIDTMKQSRDLARERNTDEKYRAQIDKQISDIAGTGANYVGIATPYDEEFLPYLTAWVNAARKYKLHVWFRGNWSAWEGWFGHSEKMGFDEHIDKSVQFVRNNASLFVDGDIFTGCPECENGTQGDPRETGQLKQYREFLIKESEALNKEFLSQGKHIPTNYLSMNMDVAKAVMDQETVSRLGGIITVDHYVRDPKQLSTDIQALADATGARVVLGEFGAPIPDINGAMSPQDQAAWLEDALAGLVNTKALIGLSYWVNIGGSTEIWKPDNSPKMAVDVIKKYFKLKI